MNKATVTRIGIADERVFQRKLIPQLVYRYASSMDGLLTFTYLRLIGTPDLILLPKHDNYQEPFNHYAMIIELKTKLGIHSLDFLGQLIKYTYIGPTYLAIPSELYDKMSQQQKNMLISTLMRYNLGLLSIDLSSNSKKLINTILKVPQDPAKELFLRDLVIWNAILKLTTIIEQKNINKIYNYILNKIKIPGYEMELKKQHDPIRIILTPMLPLLSLNYIIITIAENPPIIKVINPNELTKDFEKFIQKLVKNPLIADAINVLSNVKSKSTCNFLPGSLLMLLSNEPHVKINVKHICSIILKKMRILSKFI